MATRTWIHVISVPLSQSNKTIAISRGIPADVKETNTKTNSLYSLQIVLEYGNGFIATIPLVNDVVNTLKSFVQGTLLIPPYGHFHENDGRNYLILENKNKEVTLTFEKNKYRNTIRLTEPEIDTVVRCSRIKQMLSEKSRMQSLGIKRSDSFGHDLSLYIQYWTAVALKTPHETGDCDCSDATQGWPCQLSSTRSTVERFEELTAGVTLFAEVLKNIHKMRKILGMNIPFEGLSDHLPSLAASAPDNTNDVSFLVRMILEP